MNPNATRNLPWNLRRSPLRTVLFAIALCACAAAPGARAQALHDPTRPPAMLAPGAASMKGAGPATPQLQSVLIARQPGGRHVAVIDGQTVRLGDTFKGATVSRMSETQVVLTRGNARQVLKLFAAPQGAARAQP